MILESIHIKNYRQYIDEKIVFTKPEGLKNFTIIQGANGSGKTNLLNAITWCLYGIEKHLVAKQKGLPMINISNMVQFRDDGIKEVCIEIVMLDEEHDKIIFTRTLDFRKSMDGNLKPIPDSLSASMDGSKFQIMRQIKNEMEIINNPQYILNHLIPEKLEEYFFFDGERLNDYFKDKSGSKIREEVLKISQIDLLEAAIKHLKSKQNDFLKEVGALNPEVEGIRERIALFTSSCDKHVEKLDQKVKDKDLADKKEREYSNYLRNSDVTNVGELQEKRDRIEDYLKSLKIDLEEAETKKLDYLIKFAPSLFVYESIVNASKLISTKEEAGDIPSDYKRNFIEKLLNVGTCICGMDISNDNEFRMNVTNILEHCDKISDISEQLIKEDVRLRSILQSVHKFKTNLESINKGINRLEKNKNQYLIDLTEISEKITNCGDIEQIQNWEHKRKEYADLKEELTRSIVGIQGLIKSAKASLEQYNDLLSKELGKEEKHKKMKQIHTFCRDSLTEIESLKIQVIEDFRKELEDQTKKQFFELIWKKENYSDVKINNNYDLSVIHQSGLEGLNTLSAGERQVLALSFMAALNNVSGFDIPIIIDTPLGRISKEPKKNIAKNLPNYLKNKQVVLLVTEEEYTQDVRDALIGKVGNEYRIYFDEKQGTSKVMPYAG